MILSLLNFLHDRFNADEVCVTKLRPLGQLDLNVTDAELEPCHGCIIPDMNLAEFALQYKDAAKYKDLVELKTVPDLLKRVLACGADICLYTVNCTCSLYFCEISLGRLRATHKVIQCNKNR